MKEKNSKLPKNIFDNTGTTINTFLNKIKLF